MGVNQRIGAGDAPLSPAKQIAWLRHPDRCTRTAGLDFKSAGQQATNLLAIWLTTFMIRRGSYVITDETSGFYVGMALVVRPVINVMKL